MTVAAHNCQGYAVKLTLYMMPSDWEKVERTFKVENTLGETLYENEELECSDVGPYRIC